MAAAGATAKTARKQAQEWQTAAQQAEAQGHVLKLEEQGHRHQLLTWHRVAGPAEQLPEIER